MNYTVRQLCFFTVSAIVTWVLSLLILTVGILYAIYGHELYNNDIATGLALVFSPDSYVYITIGSFIVFTLMTLCLGVILGKLQASNQPSPDGTENTTQLLADVSHDLRTPLTSIKGYVETLLIKNDQYSQEERKELLEVVMNNTEQLSKLIDELFQYTKVKHKVATKKLEPFVIQDMVETIVKRLLPFAQDKSIQLNYTISPKKIHLQGDKLMLDRAITNVVNNAIYYTTEGGTVDVGVHVLPKKVIVEISDTGIGIPKEDLEHIFDRFYRVNKDRSRETGGTGLGLAITKTVVEAHGGLIEIDSAIGLGTTVRISLPLR